MKKEVTVVLVFLLLCIFLVSCGSETKQKGDIQTDKQEELKDEQDKNEKTPKEGGEIVIGIPQDLEDSMDPHIAVAAGTKEILFNLFEGLVKPDPEGNLIPAIASEVSLSDDAKVYKFSLRQGVKFHNGEIVTAEDVKYSLDRCADDTNGEPLIAAYNTISSIDIVDEQTITVTLKEPNTEFLSYMTTAIIPKGYDKQDTAPIGTGPFSFVSRSPQENIILQKFEDYWGEAAHLDKITLKIVPNSDTIVMDLKGGSLDLFARLTASQAAELTDDFNIEEGTMNLVQALYLNHDAEPFNNLKVRQALCYAINPQEIMDMIADGKGVEIGSSMFPAFGKYYVEELKDVYNQDIEKAKQLLTEAGYPDGFSMVITVPSNYQPHIDTAQILVEQLKQAGIAATINQIEWDSWLSDVYVGRNYETTVVGVDASSLTARALLERFYSEAGNNFINYKNEEYDKLYQDAIACTDDKKQAEIYKQIQRVLTEDAANVYIQDMAELVAVRKNIGGYTFYPLYVQDFSKLYLK